MRRLIKPSKDFLIVATALGLIGYGIYNLQRTSSPIKKGIEAQRTDPQTSRNYLEMSFQDFFGANYVEMNKSYKNQNDSNQSYNSSN